jgi:phage protein D
MPSLRQPRFTVLVNGSTLPGVKEIEVTNASHFTADTYRVTMAAGALPPALNIGYWADSVGDEITISAGYDTQSQLIIGQVDSIDYDPIRGNLVLAGRDLSAGFIDTKTSEKFANLTSVQIAQQLSVRHGLDLVADGTTTKVGTYYNIDHVQLTQEQTEWDLLIYLARQEGFDCWVSGRTLYFQKPPTGNPYIITAPGPQSDNSNATSLALSRSETLARDVTVFVKSWNQKEQRPFTATAKSFRHFKSQRSGGLSQEYHFVRPNLTKDAAQKLADSLLADITRHEKVITATLPGDNLLTTRSTIQLLGTFTAWDQVYYPDTVTRRISTEEGYRMDVRAKNHSTESTVSL